MINLNKTTCIIKKEITAYKMLIFITVSGQESNSEYTKKVLEEAIQKWLRRAKERLDAAKKKEDKQRIEQEEENE